MIRSKPPANISTHHFIDFEVEIGPGHAGTYSIDVVHSPFGEPHEQAVLPDGITVLSDAILNADVRTLREPPADFFGKVRELGGQLFGFLFTGQLRTAFEMSQKEALDQGKGLRLRLRVRPPELSVMPWEYLWDEQQNDFVALSRDVVIVRYPEIVRATTRRLEVKPPLRILGVAATPKDQPELNVEAEKQWLEQALQELTEQGLVSLEWLQGQDWRQLQRTMWRGSWNLVHFVGHGYFDQSVGEGYVALEDANRETHFLGARQLGRLLSDSRSVRLVILSMCDGAKGDQRSLFSSAAATLIQQGIPAVVAMQSVFSNQAAIEFTRSFYQAVADGVPIDAATGEARKALSLALPNSVEWGVPALFLRTVDGDLLTIQREEDLHETPLANDRFAVGIVPTKTPVNKRPWTIKRREVTADEVYSFMGDRYGLAYNDIRVEWVISEDGSALVRRTVDVEAFTELADLDIFLTVPEKAPEGEIERTIKALSAKSLSPGREVKDEQETGRRPTGPNCRADNLTALANREPVEV